MLRLRTESDPPALQRLAERDSAPPLSTPALTAEVGGEVRAAICLATGRVVADPFHPTSDVVVLLRTRAAQLGGRPGASPDAIRRPAAARLRPRGAWALSGGGSGAAR